MHWEVAAVYGAAVWQAEAVTLLEQVVRRCGATTLHVARSFGEVAAHHRKASVQEESLQNDDIVRYLSLIHISEPTRPY